jgi:spoIIIJ-associated protein
MSQQSQLADAISADDRAPADPTSEAEAQVARETLQELLEQMNIRASIQMHRSKPAPGEAEEDLPWVLDISGRDLGVLIGRRGETLNALQYVARLIASRELQKRANFVVDVEGYKSRRENTLRSLARRMAARAREQGRTVTLEPMPPNERRIIHLTLRGDNTVTTESVGTGENRKVTIIPVYEGDR